MFVNSFVLEIFCQEQRERNIYIVLFVVQQRILIPLYATIWTLIFHLFPSFYLNIFNTSSDYA